MVKCMLTSDTHYGIDGKTHNKHLKFWKKVAKTIEEEKVQILIWAGDIASHRQRHLKQSIEMAREYVDIPIVMVRGNHDLWCGEDYKDKDWLERKSSLNVLFEYHAELFKENNIHHLENNPFIIEDVIICGFDGWYATQNPETNDNKWIPHNIDGQPFVMNYLVNKAWKDLQDCFDVETSGFRKSICVTHHNPYPYNQFPGKSAKTVSECLDEGIEFAGHGANMKLFPPIRDKFDVLCAGHTHVRRDDTFDGIQIYNSGSDYNSPKFLIFDI